ncbi:isochorismatase family protein [Leifsonia bigeumensis]|uniref:Isochorismatase family protein n=1 Tax=Leifsonella bigeumensis TaxID=433643 RepID=A0ABP7FC51_9MICO
MSPLILDPATTALLVVDMQNDFCEEGGYYAGVGGGVGPVQSIIPPIQFLLEAARENGVFVLYTAITYQPADRGVPTDLTELHSLLPDTFGAYESRLLTGTWGAQIIDRLTPRSNEIVLEKPNYSVFYQTQLEALLRRRGIRTVVLTGAATNGCIIHSAYDAFVRDLDVVLVEDGVMSYWPELHDAAMAIMGAMIGPIVPSRDLVAAFGNRAPIPAGSSKDGAAL